MGSRHGGGSTYGDDREYYRETREEIRGPPVRTRERDREHEEVNTYIWQDREPGRRPEFLDRREEEAGLMVVRERETETLTRPLERRPRSPSPVRYRERVVERVERERSPDIPAVERLRTRFVEHQRDLSPPGHLRARVIETRERIPLRERTPSPVRIRERIIERRERSPSPSVQEERIRITETRETQRRPPTPSISSRSASPPPPIHAPPIHQEIITHHRHIDHGFERAERERVRVPTPPPPPRIKETDIDIYTSRNSTEVDIHQKTTMGRARGSSQSLSRRDEYYDDDVLYERERSKLRVRDDHLSLARRRSVSARPTQEKSRVRVDVRDDEGEADYYARRASDRAYIGEAYNGATQDWAIVDVPPGTKRVRMDGVGGASEEITWQKYNGVRRSKFIPERERERVEERAIAPRRESASLEIDISSRRRRHGGGVYEREYERIEESSDRRVGMPRGPKNRVGDLWTEITKDLVSKEAIARLGYDFEETEYFYYIIEYLGYEDVLRLVQLSEDIRRERKHRIHEIERERLAMEKRERQRIEWERMERRRERNSGYDDERIVEREIIYDGHGRRMRRAW